MVEAVGERRRLAERQEDTHVVGPGLGDTGGEAFYIGSTQSYGHTIPCDAGEEVHQPHFLEGVHVHHNLIENTQWDGAQIGMARSDCAFYANTIRHVGLAGVEYLLSLTLLMMLLSIVPVVGTAFVTVPIGLYMLFTGDFIGAAIVLLGQIIVISNVDNIIRAELVSHDTQLHPALMLISIIGGLQVFGFLGLIYGPVIMILFLTSLEIYTKHYKY